MRTVNYLLISALILPILASCSARDNAITRNTTAFRQLETNSQQKSSHKKLDRGVYVMAVQGPSDDGQELARKLTYNAAKLTIKKGYKRFVILKDIKDDTELETAIEERRVRKLYIKRIRKKSPLIGQTRVLLQRRGPVILRQEMFAVVVMLQSGKQGFPAVKVKRVLERIFASTRKGRNDDIYTGTQDTNFDRALRANGLFQKLYGPALTTSNP